MRIRDISITQVVGFMAIVLMVLLVLLGGPESVVVLLQLAWSIVAVWAVFTIGKRLNINQHSIVTLRQRIARQRVSFRFLAGGGCFRGIGFIVTVITVGAILSAPENPLLLMLMVLAIAGTFTAAIVFHEMQVRTGIDALDNFLHAVALSLPKAFRSMDVSPVADAAMQRAGYRPRALGLWLDDIGLLVYHGDRNPRIYRTSDVPTDATHIRPFVVIHAPSRVASGKATAIKFELLDLFDTRYIATTEQALKPGQNFITPSTWLPLKDQQLGGIWTLEVDIAQTLLAVHEFGWLQVGGDVRAQFTGDGEIDELACHLPEDQDEKVSLDELLTEQGEEVSTVENSATQ